jgi:Na+-translocating ferredoxin:NAD+ oxidoreductase RNF subunit RnfB
MGAIKNQPGLDAPDRLSARYGGVPVIYVESQEDSYVFGECWFKERLSHVEFRPATQQCNFSGCAAVIRAVADERKAGNPAWGIVDRDSVMSADMWDVVHETDDLAYENAKPFGTEIKALCRWEMENYLADGEALEKCRAELKMQLARPVQVVYQELLDHCQALVPHAAANALFHMHKVQGLGDGYTNRFPTREATDADIKSNQLPRLAQVPATTVATEYGLQLSKIDAFDIPNAEPPRRVSAMLRRVHGKAVLKRFASSHSIHADLKGLLANRIKEMALVPSELTAFVDSVCAAP